MRITVIICTRNRAEQLRHVLDSAACLEVASSLSWEMLVVDNGSTDHTRDVVESYVDRLPIRRVTEPEAGLSNARNRGVSEAAGEYICWTDDDVLIDRQWLSAYAEAFIRHPDSCYFGGPIEPVLEEPTPSWLHECWTVVGPALAERMLGDVPIRFDAATDAMPYGANYAVRSHEQRRNPYDPNLGVSPMQRRLGEETMVLATLHREGCEGWWVPGARVRHIIPPDRQTLGYFFRYQESAGETAVYVANKEPSYVLRRSIRMASPLYRGAPVHLWVLMAAHLMLYGILRPFGGAARWMRHWLDYGFFKGTIKYWRTNSNPASP